MTFSTKIIDLAGGPVNLMADADIAAAIAAGEGARVFLQNISPRAKVYYLERTDAPARASKGHCLLVGDGLGLHLTRCVTPGSWVWATTTGTVAVSPAD